MIACRGACIPISSPAKLSPSGQVRKPESISGNSLTNLCPACILLGLPMFRTRKIRITLRGVRTGGVARRPYLFRTQIIRIASRGSITGALLLLSLLAPSAAPLAALLPKDPPANCCKARKHSCCCENIAEAGSQTASNSSWTAEQGCPNNCRRSAGLPHSRTIYGSTYLLLHQFIPSVALLSSDEPVGARSAYLAFLYQRPPPCS